MAKFQGGVDGIIKALQLMNSEERDRLLSEVSKKDPRMAELINEKLYSLSDLEFISDKMLVEFLQKVNSKHLGFAFKLQNDDFVNEFSLPAYTADEFGLRDGKYNGKPCVIIPHFDENGNLVGVSVVKGSKGNADKADNQVDAISGATITGNGVSDMISERLKHYLPYFKQQTDVKVATK